jgi:hypothetical protein
VDHPHHHPVKDVNGAIDDVEMAIGGWVEAAWAEGGGQIVSFFSIVWRVRGPVAVMWFAIRMVYQVIRS